MWRHHKKCKFRLRENKPQIYFEYVNWFTKATRTKGDIIKSWRQHLLSGGYLCLIPRKSTNEINLPLASSEHLSKQEQTRTIAAHLAAPWGATNTSLCVSAIHFEKSSPPCFEMMTKQQHLSLLPGAHKLLQGVDCCRSVTSTNAFVTMVRVASHPREFSPFFTCDVFFLAAGAQRMFVCLSYITV